MHSACEGLAHPDVSIVDVPVTPGAQATQDSRTPLPSPPPDTAREHPDSGVTDAAVSQVHTRLAAVAQQASKVVRREAPSDTSGPAQLALPRSQAAPATVHSVGPRLQPKRAAAVGDAVHAALERVDLALFTDPQVPLTEVVAATSTPGFSHLSSTEQARAWAILERARSSPLLRRAALAGICRRELPISGQHEDGAELVVTQGSIDLLFAESTPDGQRRWILVDYKTDASGKSREEFAARYAEQLAVYRRLLADVGVTVAESWLVRLTETTVSDIEVVP
jgi:ATP-dependent exoDNAse (exonuclease V) beta subunit